MHVAALALFLGLQAAAPEGAVPRSECAAGELAQVEVRGHGPVQHLADELGGRATGLYEKAARFTGATDCAPVGVDLVQDNRAARALLPAWHLPPWAAGAARPDQRSIVLTVHNEGVRQDRERVLLHELAHLATAVAAEGRVPRWFDEGVARRVAGEDGVDDDDVLARAKVAGSLLLLEGLEVSFPAGQTQAAIAYAVSARAIELLEQEHGDGVVRRLLARVRAGESFDKALQAETGVWTWQLTGRVHRSVSTWHAWMTLMRSVDVGLALGAFVLVFGGVRARRRIKKRIEEMPDEGAPPPALGPPLDVSLARWTVSLS